MEAEKAFRNAKLTTPRAAALAGILFSVLLITSLAIIRISVPANQADVGEWISGSWKIVNIALNIVPFAGIAFLWFIGVVRDRLGQDEDRFFATVFFGSGLLFLGLLFMSTAIAGSTINLYGSSQNIPISSGIYTFGRTTTYEIMNVYTMKMAGVFMISTCTLSLRTGIIPRWMAFLGIVLALFLLFSIGFFAWASLVFPMWVFLISLHILIANMGRPSGAPVP